jgi:hypothetical protein
MSNDPKKQDLDLEKLVEAQARGEKIDVPTEQEAPNDAELDKRVSKGDPYAGGIEYTGS